MTYIRVFTAFITISRKKDKNIFTKMITSSGHQSYIRHHSRTSELNQRAIPCTIATKKKKTFFPIVFRGRIVNKIFIFNDE